MIRDILRVLGGGCILAGGILYFTIESNSSTHSEMLQLQNKTEKLEKELMKTKEALAIAQTASAVKKIPKEEKEIKGSKVSVNEDFPKEPIINTILTIELGSNSSVVSATLERLEIIKDAALFDAYLVDNDLTGKIQIGEHKVDSSMDFHAISKEITNVK